MGKRGPQPVLLKQGLRAVLLELAKTPASVNTIADVMRIPRSTLKTWLRLGDTPGCDEVYSEFLADWRHARAQECTQSWQDFVTILKAAESPDAALKRFERLNAAPDPAEQAWEGMDDEEAAEAMARLPIVRDAVARQLEAEKVAVLTSGGDGDE